MINIFPHRCRCYPRYFSKLIRFIHRSGYAGAAILISGVLVSCGGKEEITPPEVWTDELVHSALKANNPDYTGKAAFRIDGGKVIGMELSGTGVTDLSSLEGMGLRGLDLRGSGIEDISLLKGLPLEELYLEDTEVADLEPLRGMKLKKLYLNNTRVKDLDPLKGMPLIMLNLFGTEVEDLEPLRGMPLQYLWLNETPVSKIEPIAGCPLVSLTLHRTGVKNIGPVAKIPTLQRIHIGETPIIDLTPIEGMKLQRLIFTPDRITRGIDIVKKMYSLQEIGTTFENRMPPGQFWAIYSPDIPKNKKNIGDYPP